MKLEKGSRVEFTYEDKQHEIREWSGIVTSADPQKDWFRMDTGDEHPRTFRYERIQGEVRFPVVA